MSGDTALEKQMSTIEKNLGVTKKEAEVLLPVYVGGNMTAGALSVITGDTLGSVKRTLSRLVKKGLVAEIEGIVPVYQAISPNLAVGDALSSFVERTSSLQEQVQNTIDKQLGQAKETSTDFMERRKSAFADLKEELDVYEDEMLDNVQSQIEIVGSVADKVLTGFSERVESVLDTMGATLDSDLGEQLSTLQNELDSIQGSMNASLEEIGSSFSETLDKDKASASENASQFRTSAVALVDQAKEVVEKAIDDSQVALQSVLEKMSANIQSSIEDSVSRTTESLGSVDEGLVQVVENISEEIGNKQVSSQKSLSELVDMNRDLFQEYASLAGNKIGTTATLTGELVDEIEKWKDEVGDDMAASTQSIAAQFEQIKATDVAYLEDIKNALSSHLERLASMISENHDELKTLVAGMQSRFGTHVTEARAEVIRLLDEQNASEQASIEEVRANLQAKLDSWAEEGEKDVYSDLEGVINDVNETLSVQTDELKSLTSNMSDRLKSSFGTIQSSVKTKNETVLSGVSRFVNDLESGFGKTLEETVTEISSKIQKNIKDTKELYKTLNSQLDDRLVQSVSTLASEVGRVQEEVDSTITDQVQRIDRQGEEIRGEFHLNLEEMTRQFIALTQSLESTFNGLITSQTMESRDLISSTHTEFKNSIKTEIEALQEDSLKLQQEYTSEIALRIDEIVDSVSMMRKSLNDFSVEKQAQLSEKLASTHSMIESNLQAVEDNLDQIRHGTIKQMGESLVQTSREFETSVAGAQTNFHDRVAGTRESVKNSFARTSASMRSTVDNYASEQADEKQRLLADTTKKLDKLSTEVSNRSIESMESYQEQLVAREKEIIDIRRDVNDDISAAIEQRRDEANEAFDAAAQWVENALDNVSTSSDALGNKLTEDIQLASQNLTKASEEVSEGINDRGEHTVEQFEKSVNALLEKTGSSFKARLNEFQQATKTRLRTGTESVSNLEKKLTAAVEANIEDAGTWTEQRKSDIIESLTSDREEYLDSVESLTTDYTSLVENASNRIDRRREDLFEKTRETVVSSNLTASRRFENIALELKTKLSNDAYQLVEEMRNELGVRGSELREVVTKANGDASTKTSTLTEKRNDLLNSFESDTDKSAKNLLSSIRKDGKELKQKIEESVNTMKELATNTMDVLDAIHTASKSVQALPSKKTWYVSGADEIYAHMVDMAERAEESVLLSVVDVEGLDLKKLSKVNTPRRKVLVVPRSEEQPAALKNLAGWRIWETAHPYDMALCDQKELLLGGSTDSGRPVALVSSDPAYLTLYHDVLGPRLVESRRS